MTGAVDKHSPQAFEERCKDAMRAALIDVARATTDAELLVAEARDGGPDRAMALTALAHACSYAGSFDRAVGLLREAGECCAESQRFMILNALVQPLLRLGRTADAEATASEAVRAAEALGDEASVAKALVGLGAAERARGNILRAEQTLARVARTTDPQSIIAASALSNRAECLLDLERFDEAIAAFAEASRVFDQAGRTHAAAIADGNRADAYARLGRIDSAMRSFDDARSRFEQVGADLDAARLLCEQGEMLAQAGALRAARDRYAVAIPALVRSSAGIDLSRAAIALAGVLLQLGDDPGTEDHLALASRAVDGGLPPNLEAQADITMASILLRRGDTAAAERLAGRIAERTDSALRRFAAVVLLSRIAAARSDHSASLGYAQMAERHAEAIGVVLLGCMAKDAVADALDAIGDHDAAITASTRSCDDAEEAFRMTVSASARAGLSAVARSLFDRRASRLLDRASPEALDAIVRAAAWSTPTFEPMQGEPGVVARVELVSQRIAAATAALGAFGGPDPSIAELHSLNRVLREHTDFGAVNPLPVGPLDTAAVAASLPSDSVLLHWFDDQSRQSLLLVSQDQRRVFRHVVTKDEIERVMRRLGLLLSAMQAPRIHNRSVRAVLNRLTDLLIGGIDPSGIARHRVFISGSPALVHLPWNSLLAGRGVHPQGGVRCLTTLAGPLPRKRVDTQRTAILLADDASLPAAAAEGEAVRAHWPHAAVVFGGSRSEWLSAIADASIVHIATHGVFEPDRPSASRLWVGDGWMSVLDLAHQIAPDAVLVLSACHAGRHGGLAEDAAGVPSIFCAHGAREVVAPIWALRDASCPKFFGCLHAVLSRQPRASAAEALTHAHAAACSAGHTTADLLGVLSFGGAL